MQQALRHYAKSIYAAGSLGAGTELLSDTASALGFEGASCLFWPASSHAGDELPPPLLFVAGSSNGVGALAWVSDYVKSGMHKVDFCYRACLGSAVPVLWSSDCRPEIVVGNGRPASPQELDGVEQARRRTGLRGGISVPIHAPSGVFGYVAYSSRRRLPELLALREDSEDHLLGMTHRFYDAMADKIVARTAQASGLTARELDCISLLALGKTLSETGEILGLSYSTIRFHLHNAERKLGTHSRTHAIAKAAALGLLGRVA
jgi:DNA-binding CsgD family transcriptional regulator